MRFSMRCLLPLLLFASCGGSQHALAGGWSQQLPGEAKGAFLQVKDDGSKMVVHGAERPEGGHDHPTATFTFDAATKAITIECALLGDGKATTWKGTVNGDVLELSSPDGKLKFQRGGEAQGH